MLCTKAMTDDQGYIARLRPTLLRWASMNSFFVTASENCAKKFWYRSVFWNFSCTIFRAPETFLQKTCHCYLLKFIYETTPPAVGVQGYDIFAICKERKQKQCRVLKQLCQHIKSKTHFTGPFRLPQNGHWRWARHFLTMAANSASRRTLSVFSLLNCLQLHPQNIHISPFFPFHVLPCRALSCCSNDYPRAIGY